MGRIYTVNFSAVSISAAQDLVQIKGASNKVVKIRRCWLGPTDTTLVTAQSLSLRTRLLPATVTDGSGGSTPTPRRADPGDAAATFTALANNTTQATTNGTATICKQNGVHIYGAGGGDVFVWEKGTEPIVVPSTSFVFELLSTVSGTVTLSGGVEVEEIG